MFWLEIKSLEQMCEQDTTGLAAQRGQNLFGVIIIIIIYSLENQLLPPTVCQWKEKITALTFDFKLTLW